MINDTKDAEAKAPSAAAIAHALSSQAAAIDAPEVTALIDVESGRVLTWKEVSAAITTIDPPASLAATNTIDTVLTILAALERNRPLAIGPTLSQARTKPMAHPDTALAILTSGSSASPRLVEHRASALVAHAHASALALDGIVGDRWLVALPIAHVSGLGPIIRALVFRRSVALMKKFDTDRFIAAIAAHQITLTSVVPTMLRRLVEQRWHPPAHLRHLLVGGAACSDRLNEQARDLGIPTTLCYGMTETFSHIAINGQLLPGIEARTGKDGTLFIRGPSSTTWPQWLRTQDLATLTHTPNGIRIDALSRADDVIISGGENVSPTRVRDALIAHPLIEDAHVMGINDPEWGQRVVAMIATEAAINIKELDDQLRSSLAGHERPRRYVVVRSIPLLPSGKPDSQTIAKQLADEL